MLDQLRRQPRPVPCLRAGGRPPRLPPARGEGVVSVQPFRTPAHPAAWYAATFREQSCFFGDGLLAAPFSICHGFGEPIALHPPCVVELTIRLYRDVWEIECSPGYGYVTERSLTALRERLVREEGRG